MSMKCVIVSLVYEFGVIHYEKFSSLPKIIED